MERKKTLDGKKYLSQTEARNFLRIDKEEFEKLKSDGKFYDTIKPFGLTKEYISIKNVEDVKKQKKLKDMPIKFKDNPGLFFEILSDRFDNLKKECDGLKKDVHDYSLFSIDIVSAFSRVLEETGQSIGDESDKYKGSLENDELGPEIKRKIGEIKTMAGENSENVLDGIRYIIGKNGNGKGNIDVFNGVYNALKFSQNYGGEEMTLSILEMISNAKYFRTDTTVESFKRLSEYKDLDKYGAMESELDEKFNEDRINDILKDVTLDFIGQIRKYGRGE